MKRSWLIAVLLVQTAPPGFGQYSSQEISTDSSNIEIIRNSVYHIYEETYKDKDSVWYSVHFIKDTTRLNTEGWKTKASQYIGVWREYNFEGQLMYTWDHDNATCEVNPDLYPYHELLVRMKSKSDSLIISTYSQEFFQDHVRFDFNCAAYDGKGYVGSWTEPMERKPMEFLFRYSVKLTNSEWYDEMIGIKLDFTGKYKPSHDVFNNYGFEKVKSQKRTFQIDKHQAIMTAQEHGLQESEPDSISEFLTWEKFRKAQFYDGEFRYYISELTGTIKDIQENGRSSVVYKFNVYSFNPWTGDFVELKKMRNIHSWERLSGYWTGLISDKE